MEVTWWGHATCTVEDSGVRVLTDPLFARRLAHLRRRRGELPSPRATEADVVLISHLHSDHLHLPSLARLAPGSRLIVPSGAVATVPGLRMLRRVRAFRITEVAPGDVVRVGEVRVRAVPALHDGRRLPVGPRRVPALGYVVEGEVRTYFAGDTGLFDTMADAVGPVDVALLPVGGWGPNLGHSHLDPSRAAEALTRLEPSAAVPVHFGTYWPIGLDGVRPHEFHSPGDEFVRKAALVAPEVAVHLLGHGERVRPEAGR
ncbi:MBL fold metallo-hydrolase [Streptomyces sp. BE147]|uniref:MBL fold metallo-hydrolase n=1 Tax=unclassified Streptomyces TaxID=2593676 RepID=UPI002E79ED91|nr:MBL fold metallo-hydrolase [Streptomyces sp. BE147]MEE1742107.1 MBL fold metallo-hydrolase [Streptomyces sp. BE147]